MAERAFSHWRPHPWHGLSHGAEAPGLVTVYIEITPFYFGMYKLVPGEPPRTRVNGTYGYEHAAAVVEAAIADYAAHFGEGA